MPLVVFCGHPSTGKSTWANRLAEFLRKEKEKNVIIVREQDYFRAEKNDVLDDSRKEKELRGKLKSEAQRLLNKEDVVIIDALNYIKGYRYEIYCMSKAVPTRQVTIQCEAADDVAWEWNLTRPQEEQYTRTVFNHLIQRFEDPDPANRWDSPYFNIIPGEDLDFEQVYTALFSNKPPKQNMSTQSKPVSESSYLVSFEKVTSDIINALMEEQKKRGLCFQEDAEVEVPHSTIQLTIKEGATFNLAQLMRFKRQFIAITKVGGVQGQIGDLFVQYLNSQFK